MENNAVGSFSVKTHFICIFIYLFFLNSSVLAKPTVLDNLKNLFQMIQCLEAVVYTF